MEENFAKNVIGWNNLIKEGLYFICYLPIVACTKDQ